MNWCNVLSSQSKLRATKMTSTTYCLFLLALPAALAYQLPSAMAPHALASQCRRARWAVCEEAATEGEDPGAADAPADPKAEKKALREAIAVLEAQLPVARGELNAAEAAVKDAGENGYMLIAANFERYRQQASKEMDSQKGYGRQATLRALLPFIERFEELQAMSEEAGEGAAIHSYYGGIYKQTEKLLGEWGATPFEAAAGETFDFNLHQSTARVASEEVGAGIIIEAQERGWKIADGTLRQAKVVVSTGPAVKEEEAAAEELADEASADGADGAEAA